MKKTILSLVIATLSIFSTVAQNLLNGDFENWSTTGISYNPTGWESSNDLVGQYGFSPVTKEESQVQNGTYAVKLTNMNVYGTFVPGLVGIVKIDPFTYETSPKIAFTARPERFTGYFKYAPVNGDIFLALATLTKWNGTSRITIGTAQYTNGSPVNNYTGFSVPFTYVSGDTPDSLTLIVSSSVSMFNAVPGSVAYVDNLNFVYGSNGINEFYLNNSVNIYPNPSKNKVYLNNLPDDYTIQIYHISGQLLQTKLIRSGKGTIDVSTFANGIYLIKGDGLSKKLIIAN